FVRVSRDGLAYFCPYIGWFAGWGDVDSVLARPRIRLLTDEDMFDRLYRDLGFRVRLSDKGKYHREAVAVFGGLGKMAEFLRGPTGRALLDLYLDKSRSGADKGVYLDSIRRRYLSFRSIRNVSGSAPETVTLLDDLLLRGVLSRGLIFQCARCSYAGWYPIGDISNVFRCTRCRMEQQYSSQHWKMPEEPEWHY